MKNRHLLKFSLILFSLLLLAHPYLLYADYPDGYYNVGTIIDGDTFKLTDGKSVRLIGIDTPEIDERCGTEAKQQLSSLISGKNVYLEKDVSETDQYDRLLRYVYADGIFVNDRLVYNGYAYAVRYPPDTKYSNQLEDSENSAESSGRGCLWEIDCCIDDDGGHYWAAASCFIATAAYGSPIDPHVKILRKFRDEYLVTNKLGRGFVNLYYSYSPKLAKLISKHEILKAVTRICLWPIVGLSWVILKIGLETTLIVIMLISGGFIHIVWFKSTKNKKTDV
jgi:endonuclease YncB( thermonuclease family)